MRVKMKTQMSGTRNGVAWPNRGDVLEDVSDAEAADLIRADIAEATSDGDAKKVADVIEEGRGWVGDDPQMPQSAQRADQPPERHPVEATVINTEPRAHPSLHDYEEVKAEDVVSYRATRPARGDKVTVAGTIAEQPAMVDSKVESKDAVMGASAGSSGTGDKATDKDSPTTRKPITTQSGPVKK